MGLLSRSLFIRLIAIRSLDRLISRWGFGVGWLGVAIHLKNSIALAIHSLDPTRTIALAIRSLDPTRTIALAIRSLDPTRLSHSLSTRLILQELSHSLFTRLILQDYRTRYPLA